LHQVNPLYVELVDLHDSLELLQVEKREL